MEDWMNKGKGRKAYVTKKGDFSDFINIKESAIEF